MSHSNPEELEELRLGYADLSQDGEATAILQALTPEERRIIYRYAHHGPAGVIGHVGYLFGLAEQMDTHDPKRSSAAAVEVAREEVAAARDFLAATMQHSRLPALGRFGTRDELNTDMARMGWGVVPTTGQEQDDARTYMPSLDVLDNYLLDPTAHAAAKADAHLAFLNDVIFRPGVSLG